MLSGNYLIPNTRKEEFVAQNFVKSDLNRARAKFSPPPTLREGVLDRFHLLFYPNKTKKNEPDLF